jgi:hypothetical protein
VSADPIRRSSLIHTSGLDGRSGEAATAFERHRKRRLIA